MIYFVLIKRENDNKPVTANLNQNELKFGNKYK